MITIRLKGGLGNQMFQYAFAKGIAHSLNTDFQIDCSLLLDRARGKDMVYRDYDLDILNVRENFSIRPSNLRMLYKIHSSKVGKVMRGRILSGKSYIKEKHFHVDQDLLKNLIDGALYDGWWQSPQYFSHIEKELREDFVLKIQPLESSVSILDRIKRVNSVCLNVRRTDFVANKTLNTTNQKYFIEAASHMASLVESPVFFIFSDDIDWCRENIKLDYPFEIVDHEMKGFKFSNYMRLMISCHHFIIPNSSFAWWAAWLNEELDKKVIAPQTWFNDTTINTNDLVPKSWIRL